MSGVVNNKRSMFVVRDDEKAERGCGKSAVFVDFGPLVRNRAGIGSDLIRFWFGFGSLWIVDLQRRFTFDPVSVPFRFGFGSRAFETTDGADLADLQTAKTRPAQLEVSWAHLGSVRLTCGTLIELPNETESLKQKVAKDTKVQVPQIKMSKSIEEAVRDASVLSFFCGEVQRV